MNSKEMVKLAYNALQILGRGAVKIHGFPVNDADHAFSVHEKDAFQQCAAEYLRLQIGFFIKCLFYETAEIKAIGNQLCRRPKGFRRRIGILEHARIMDNADIKRFGNLFLLLECKNNNGHIFFRIKSFRHRSSNSR